MKVFYNLILIDAFARPIANSMLDSLWGERVGEVADGITTLIEDATAKPSQSVGLSNPYPDVWGKLFSVQLFWRVIRRREYPKKVSVVIRFRLDARFRLVCCEGGWYSAWIVTYDCGDKLRCRWRFWCWGWGVVINKVNEDAPMLQLRIAALTGVKMLWTRWTLWTSDGSLRYSVSSIAQELVTGLAGLGLAFMMLS